MVNYFWDTGVFIGYCFYYDEDKLPKGMSIKEIDNHSLNSNKFVKKTIDDKHIVSEHTIKNEIPRKFAYRKRCIKMLILQSKGKFKISDPMMFQLSDKDWDWIDEKTILFKKYNKDEVVNVLTDILAKLEIRKDYLLKYVTKNIHKNYKREIYKELLSKIDNYDDSRIFATAIDYHTEINQIKFITTDKHFEDIDKKGFSFSVPETLFLWDF